MPRKEYELHRQARQTSVIARAARAGNTQLHNVLVEAARQINAMAAALTKSLDKDHK